MNKITPFLWFDDNAEAAADFYLSIFASGRKLNEFRPKADGPVLAMDLELDGQKITFMNGGPGHPLTDAFSLVVRCENQEEIDQYWEKLTDGGSEVACGWLKDKFGLSWQIVPTDLTKLLRKPSAMQAMMTMKKLIIADLV